MVVELPSIILLTQSADLPLCAVGHKNEEITDGLEKPFILPEK